MAAVVGRKEEPADLVVGGDDDAGDVQHVVGPDVFRIDPERVGRRGDQRLGRLVEGEAVDVAEVFAFRDAQYDRLGEFVEVAQHRLRRNFGEVPRTDSDLQRREKGVLADALLAAENQRVVDLLAGPLRAMGEPAFDVIGFIGPQRMEVVAPEPDVAARRGDDHGAACRR